MKNSVLVMILICLLAVSANADCTETVSIGTKAQLDEFRDVVNGLNGKTKNSAACAVLTADIQYATFTMSMSEGTASAPADTWTPMVGFSGTFDGQGHSISGLYYVATKTTTTENCSAGYCDAGFFASLAGNAVVKNLRIQDSYFAADERAGGITADVKEGANVKIDNVSFKGIITSVTADASCGSVTGIGTTHVNGHFGGLVGTVADGVESFELTNSYNEGVITTSGKCTESRNSGFLIGSVRGSSTILTVTNCYNSGSVERAASTDKVISENKSKGTASVVSQEEYASNIASQKSSTADSLNESTSGFLGVTFSYSDNKLTATIHSAATELKIPWDVFVDEVVLDRTFSNNKSSTIALPFTISPSSVQGATFYYLTGITSRDQNDENSRDTVEATEANTIVAYKPYLVNPAETNGTLKISGAVTLKASEGATLVDNFVENWNFVTVLKKKKWAEGGDNEDELGKVYGFAGAQSGSYHAGDFVLIGKAYIMPMRAYLIYGGDISTCGKALCKPSAVELPEEFVVRFGAPKTESVVEEVSSIEVSDETPSIEGFDEPTTGIVQSIRIPATVKDSRWFDIKGRSASHRPKSHGAFITNRTPVVVK